MVLDDDMLILRALCTPVILPVCHNNAIAKRHFVSPRLYKDGRYYIMETGTGNSFQIFIEIV